MKKIFGILSIFLGVGFIVCFALGLSLPVPNEVPQNGLFLYKFYTGMQYFMLFLPAVVFTGFLVACSVYFGHNSEDSSQRFSLAMGKRYKIVMISSIICTFVLTLSNETFGIIFSQGKEKIVNRPKIIQEYIDVGNKLFSEGLYNRSLIYAEAALNLDPDSAEAIKLKNRSDMEINKESINNLRFDLTNPQPLEPESEKLDINVQQLQNVYQCLLKAASAYDKEEWFNAHYYAEMGIKLTTSKDPNLAKLKSISAESWNNLTEMHKTSKSEKEQIFNQKYNGFLSLMEDDDLQAYYIFRYLDEAYPELKKDNDVQFYYDIAKKRVEQKYFFIDETFELESFEDANDVYFSYKQLDGTVDIIYFKGMTLIKSAGQTIQYLRDFTILKLKNGKWVRTMHVPYAKVMSVSVKSLNSLTKQMLNISDETDYVPYILLKSIGRDDRNQVYTPLYTYANGETEVTPEYLIYPIPYSDFLLLEKSATDPKNLSLTTLFTLQSRASDFGFSEELFTHTMLNRLLYPLFLLVLLVMTAGFAWNYRIGDTLYFRMNWVFSFPFFILLLYVLYQITLYLFKLMNYAIIGFVGSSAALITGIIFYVVLLIFSSIYFLSRHT